MKCPACQQDIFRNRNGACPRCHTKLDVFVYTVDGEMKREYRIPKENEEKATEIQLATQAGATVTDVDGRLLTAEGDNPEIILVSRTPRKYKVTYRYHIEEKIYCPDCHRFLFQNTIVNSVFLQQILVCHSCKSETSFVFITNQLERGY